jgi:hypothetical protein
MNDFNNPNWVGHIPAAPDPSKDSIELREIRAANSVRRIEPKISVIIPPPVDAEVPVPPPFQRRRFEQPPMPAQDESFRRRS